MEEAERLQKLPTYIFATQDKLKAEARKRGAELIDLGLGSPDHTPPQEVIEEMIKALRDPSNHRYPSFDGSEEFKQAAIHWVKKQYNVHIVDEEIVPLIGSKEGLVHLQLAYLNPGDTTLVPMPAYPAHFRGAILSGAEPIVLPTTERTGYLPNLKIIDESIAKKAKMLFLSYPTNPTGATVPKEFFEEAIAFSRKHDILLVHDFAYAELYFDGQKPISILSIPGAKEVAIEFHTMSKTFGMAGWRCGYAIGNKKYIESLRSIKTNLDYGLFTAIQKSAVKAFQTDPSYIDNVRARYQNRRDVVLEELSKLGCDNVLKPKGAMYVWFPIPKGFNSYDWMVFLMEKAHVVITPGIAFGELGEGYARISLIEPEDRLREAFARMRKAGVRYG
jgi:LL-diaminopimelate aminotransferase